MKFSENWLRQRVTTDLDRDALTHRLTMAGLEVESVTPLEAPVDAVVVGEIVAAEPHPQADRLQLCRVDAGSGEPLQIVCGAPNARVGLKAPLATVGATLPDGTAIQAAKLRGVESFGMLCSARELGLASDASGLMELHSTCRNGESVATSLGLPDAVIELGLTPDRPDCLGMDGLARDVAAILGTETRALPGASSAVATDATRDVQLAAGDDCPRYAGRVIEGVDVHATTPAWMAQRLQRADVTPISLVVDITNYVMLETGQPLHAFDNAMLAGSIRVRHAEDGEALTLLDDSEVSLAPDFMVIADDQQPLAVAGVMGGKASRVTDTTQDVFLEAAHFAPAAIMGKARRLGLHTDASHRFERGVDAELPTPALERATQLLQELAGGRAGAVTTAENRAALPAAQPIGLRPARLARILGTDIEASDVERILTALDLSVSADGDAWRALPPSRRFDLTREEDLVEEVARIHGYDRLPMQAPAGQLDVVPQPETRRTTLALAEQLVERDYRESINMAFVGADLLGAWRMAGQGVPLANPLTTDMAVMRPSLLPGLVTALKRNLARQQSRVRLFETGHVFAAPARAGAAPVETARAAWVACGPATAEQWGVSPRELDFHDIRGDLDALIAATGEAGAWTFVAEETPAWLHPGRAAQVQRDGETVGVIGMLHPECLAALDLDRDVYIVEIDRDALCRRRLPHASRVGRFPAVRRDIAVELPRATSWAAVEASVRSALGPHLETLQLFDEYRGEGMETGHKSFAMGLILRDESRTLTDDDASRCVADAVAALERDCKARLRG